LEDHEMNEQRVYRATETARDIGRPGDKLRPISDLLSYGRQYARARPEVVALWCFGVGFALGWKLKMW
jgi:hypothetical protein